MNPLYCLACFGRREEALTYYLLLPVYMRSLLCFSACLARRTAAEKSTRPCFLMCFWLVSPLFLLCLLTFSVLFLWFRARFEALRYLACREGGGGGGGVCCFGLNALLCVFCKVVGLLSFTGFGELCMSIWLSDRSIDLVWVLLFLLLLSPARDACLWEGKRPSSSSFVFRSVAQRLRPTRQPPSQP